MERISVWVTDNVINSDKVKFYESRGSQTPELSKRKRERDNELELTRPETTSKKEKAKILLDPEINQNHVVSLKDIFTKNRFSI